MKYKPKDDKSNVIRSGIQGENCKRNKGNGEKIHFFVFILKMGGNNSHRPLGLE